MSTITSEVQLKKSKLESQKKHLENLLGKRARLDYEIKTLKRSLNKQVHQTVKTIKESSLKALEEQGVQLEANLVGFYTQVDQISPEFLTEITELDEILVETLELLTQR